MWCGPRGVGVQRWCSSFRAKLSRGGAVMRALLALACVISCAGVGQAAAPPAPTELAQSYRTQEMRGWTLRINERLFAERHEKLRQQTLELLDDHLYRITRVVPATALEKLRKVPIWVELAHPRHPCMCYHPSAEWLRDHGMLAEKAGGVELANCRNFLDW